MYTACYYIILFLVFIISLYALYIIMHLVWWLLPDKSKQIVSDAPPIKVSVIIPARNEENTIGNCLGSIFKQDYPANLIELIVCDDHSDDQTEHNALRTASENQRQIRCIKLGQGQVTKKAAIEAAIKTSAGELIIVTDADCTAEKTWISALVSAYKTYNANMLCGPVAIKGEKNICEKFQGLEMCGLSLLSGAGARAGTPLLCNGANIAYKKSIFEEVEGFKGISHTPSGDDTLLMFKIHKKHPGTVHYVKNRAAFVYTPAQPGWKAFFNQRIRWASKGFRSGSSLNSTISLLVFLANFLPLLCIFIAFIFPIYIKIIASWIALKLIVDFLLLSFATNFFRKSSLLLYYPIAIVIVMLYTSLLGIMANFYKYTWKNRNY